MGSSAERRGGTCAATGVRHPHCLKVAWTPRVVADACVKSAHPGTCVQPAPELIQDPTPPRFTGPAPGSTAPHRLLLVLKDLSGLLEQAGLLRHSRSRFPCFISSRNELALRVFSGTRWAWSGGRNTGQGGQGSRRLRHVATRTASRERERWVGPMVPLGCSRRAARPCRGPRPPGTRPSWRHWGLPLHGPLHRSVLGSACHSACAPGLCSVRWGLATWFCTVYN